MPYLIITNNLRMNSMSKDSAKICSLQNKKTIAVKLFTLTIKLHDASVR